MFSIDEATIALNRAERLAGLSKWGRLRHVPFRLGYSYLFRVGLYPILKQGVEETTQTFFNLPMTVKLPAGTDLYLLGIKSHLSEIRLAKFLLRYLKKGHNFVDIGAHFGYYTLLASALVGEEGNVAAFEPTKSTFELLKKNTIPYENVNRYNRAVSDEEGIAVFYEFPVLQSEYNSLNVEQFKDDAWYKKQGAVKVEIPTVTLDLFCQKKNFRPTMVKIDVEGAEFQVLKGMKELFGEAAPIVIVEYVKGRAEQQDILDYLRSYDYVGHVIDEDGKLLPIGGEMEDSENLVFIRE